MTAIQAILDGQTKRKLIGVQSFDVPITQGKITMTPDYALTPRERAKLIDKGHISFIPERLRQRKPPSEKLREVTLSPAMVKRLAIEGRYPATDQAPRRQYTAKRANHITAEQDRERRAEYMISYRKNRKVTQQQDKP